MTNHADEQADGTDDSETDYDVGYGKPPKHGQFKKGNKKGGRKKGSLNLSTMVRKALEATVRAKINGEETKMTKVEMSLHQLANKAIAGDLKAIAKVVELYQLHGPQETGVISAEMTGYALETIIHHLRFTGVLPWDQDDEEGADE